MNDEVQLHEGSSLNYQNYINPIKNTLFNTTKSNYTIITVVTILIRLFT